MRFVAKTLAALVAVSLSLSGIAHAATPLISAFIGTQTSTSHTAYFVLDFNDIGANPETYAFGWYYEGTKTAADFPVALASALTGTNGFVQTGAQNNFITKLGYNGRVIDGANDPNGYWNFWLGFDGNTWSSSQYGAQSIALGDTPTTDSQGNLTDASWTGWRWVPQYVPGVTPPAPRTPVIVPEPATVVLLALGLAGAGVARRKKRTA